MKKEVAIEELEERLDKLVNSMEKMRIAEYVAYLDRPAKLIFINFLIGIARGLGSTVGLAIVLGLGFFILQELVMLNLPLISDFIAEFVDMIEQHRSVYFN